MALTSPALTDNERKALARASESRFVGCGEPGRVLVAGDTHLNTKWVLRLVGLAARHGCAGILQLGDFGYWSHQPRGEAYLDKVDESLGYFGLWLLVSPGNHDNADLLGRHPLHDDGYWWLRDHIAVAPFGTRWTWQGVRFGALGGAYSIDQHLRTASIDWWPGEEPTEDDAARLGDEPFDTLICHDVPLGGEPEMNDNLRGYVAWRAVATRRLLRDVVRKHRPGLVLHGHWHVRHTKQIGWLDPAASEAAGEPVWDMTTVEGLASDIQADTGAWGVLCLDGDGQYEFVPGDMVASKAEASA